MKKIKLIQLMYLREIYKDFRNSSNGTSKISIFYIANKKH